MSALILAVHPGVHDAGAAVFEGYELKAAVQQERLTRHKGDGRFHPDLSIDEALAIVGATRRDVDVIAFSRAELPVDYFTYFRGLKLLRERYRTLVHNRQRRSVTHMLVHQQTPNVEDLFDVPLYQHDCGFRDDAAFYFYNHHEAHALPALFYTDWDDALLVTADGGGDTVNYSYRHFGDGRMTTIYGGDDYLTRWSTTDSIGQMYAAATEALGFTPRRHEGKVTGLAAMGEPVLADRIAAGFSVDETGRVHSIFRKNRDMLALMRELVQGARREDIAASVQKVLEDVMLLSVQRLLERHPARHLGVAGGVFANVKLNRLLAEQLPIEEIFVVPPMGDEGMPMGGALAYLLRRDGLDHWLRQRRRLTDVYLGRDYTDDIDRVLRSAPGVRSIAGAPVALTVERLTQGRIGAIYTGRMEYGPRALGARSILANPSERATHDLLNSRLDRTEFMPFAPIVRAERAAEVFDITNVNAYACRFMTITCDVRPAWRERIKAVVHVDGSARPQVIERDVNPLYYDIVQGFEQATGIPVLVNTSFNVHEEPIVNAPAECVQALTDGRIDFVVTQQALYEFAPN